MSFDLTTNVQSERKSPSATPSKTTESAPKSRKREAGRHEITEADLETLRRNLPIFAFFENLPESVIDGMEAVSKQNRRERFVPLG
jgi:hypothetical protein